MCGDGINKKNIMNLVNSFGLESVVRFLGNVNNINEILQAMDVFIMPSFHEGFPFALIEAQASGLPCLISDTISKETDLLPYNIFMSLAESDYSWSNQLEKLRSNVYDRSIGCLLLRNKGYDSKDYCRFVIDKLKLLEI